VAAVDSAALLAGLSRSSNASPHAGYSPFMTADRRPNQARPHEHLLLTRHLRGEPGVAASFAHVVFDRPEKRNALTPAMVRAFVGTIDELAGDDDVRAVCITGEGNLFCAGFDLPLCQADPKALPALLGSLSEAVAAMRRCVKPVVIGAHGAALAGGCALLAGADLVVADRGCKLGYPVANLGISPAVSAPSLLTRLGPGSGAARRRLLDPGLTTAEEAAPHNLIDVLVELPEDVAPRAQLESMRLAKHPPAAVAAVKRHVASIDGSSDDERRRVGLGASLSLTDDAEYHSRLGAFLAGRP